jgi:hypothetical protein
MTMRIILAIVLIAGGLGGSLNALITDNGFIRPQWTSAEQGKVLRPGFLGNILIGAVAAVISWCLYGPHAVVPLVGVWDGAEAQQVTLTLTAFAGAVLVGVGGTRWLTNEVDKKMLRVAASQAAAGPPDTAMAQQMMIASPASALVAIPKTSPQNPLSATDLT